MLTAEENERLTRVGPGTPMGELMRRYWQPFLPAAKLDENPVQKVRLLGEDLVCYRDLSGRVGLVGQRCAHRLVSLEFGIPDESGLRCPYHG
ncbi:MAG TPA: Rieske 2Fe-2S domain-containing protein, partial [Acidimicrobiales bacterium]|nr:Rieske 2Fe-2S domain-containing protein [Acidimicrobiales bacterium]